MSTVDNLLDKLNNLRHALGHANDLGRRLQAKQPNVGFAIIDVLLRDLASGDFLFIGARNDLIIDVGVITNEVHFIAEVPQPPKNQIGKNERPSVSDMKRTINRWPATIEQDFPGRKGLEFLAPARPRIGEKELFVHRTGLGAFCHIFKRENESKPWLRGKMKKPRFNGIEALNFAFYQRWSSVRRRLED